MLSPALTKCIISQPKPFIVTRASSFSLSSPITIDLPAIRPPGSVLVVLICNFGGTATPATPTGWTSMSSAAASATLPGFRVAYKRVVGTEAATTSSAAASSTIIGAICYTLSDVSNRENPASGGSASGTSTAPNAGNFSTAVAGRAGLWFSFFAAASSGISVENPAGSPYHIAPRILQGVGLTLYIVFSGIQARTADDVGAFTISSSVGWRAGTGYIPAG